MARLGKVHADQSKLQIRLCSSCSSALLIAETSDIFSFGRQLRFIGPKNKLSDIRFQS